MVCMGIYIALIACVAGRQATMHGADIAWIPCVPDRQAYHAWSGILLRSPVCQVDTHTMHGAGYCLDPFCAR